MADYRFSDAERYAVFKTHGDRCYICRVPIDMSSYHVDHVIPESLLGTARLPRVLRDLGRHATFDLNSFENWLPACASCNLLKGDTVWDPSLLVQLALQRATAKASKARSAADATVSKQALGRAVNTLLRAFEAGGISPEKMASLRPLIEDYAADRPADSEPDVVRLTPTYSAPLYEVLSDDGSVQVIRGPYGVGGGPSPGRERFHLPGCHGCGGYWFDGARCVLCSAWIED